MISSLLQKPLWQMTGEEFLQLQRQGLSDMPVAASNNPAKERRFVYGLDGLATLFKCSKPTACRIKKSGILAPAITQVGRKIIIDADLAIELAGKKKGGRRDLRHCP
ncbi:MAG: DUF3853 family protein [Bacteroidales bacterium]|nr:DUF3853 family protein [Bacteroidales bacterium]